VYPEIAAAAGMLAPEGRPYRWLSKSVSAAYTGCAAVVDIGPAMKSRVAAGSETITPWALYEPESPPAPDPAVRKELFGDAKLGLLYSGNFGRAHDAVPFLKLAERLKRDGVAVAFAVRGNCVEGLKAEMAKFDANARLVRFEEDPSQHFAAADIHLVSLKEEWAGLVVPSKYFGSLAFGKPVLYAGPDGSDIAIWTNKFETGWVLKEDNFADVAEEIRRIAGKKNELHVMGGKCFGVYQEHFSKEKMLAKWDDLVAECGRN
jgi:glycosyltransferase involved in cell wall biosynthesis